MKNQAETILWHHRANKAMREAVSNHATNYIVGWPVVFAAIRSPLYARRTGENQSRLGAAEKET
ncbi:MAG: hypothetical protein JWR26_1569 [Pedosphaera sp.]|nr:hypothetical protein [Pedosphaera sp.]